MRVFMGGVRPVEGLLVDGLGWGLALSGDFDGGGGDGWGTVRAIPATGPLVADVLHRAAPLGAERTMAPAGQDPRP